MVKLVWNNTQRVNHQNFTKKTQPYAKKNLVPRAVLMKSGLVSVNTARQVNTAHSKTIVNAPRKNNMYSVDLKNIVPKGGLTCLFAKATSDESKLWHRRLSHLNFKTMNKLVKCRTRFSGRKLESRFSESTPNVVGSGPDWLFDIDALTRTMNYEPIVAGTQSNGFAGTKASDNADPKSSHDDGSKPSSDDGKKVDEDPRKDINAVGGKTSIELLVDPNMPALEDYSIFDFTRDDEDDGVVADMNNLDTTIQVSPIPTTRIHKDHPLDQVIGDLQSATQNRRCQPNLNKTWGCEGRKAAKRGARSGEPAWRERAGADQSRAEKGEAGTGKLIQGRTRVERAGIRQTEFNIGRRGRPRRAARANDSQPQRRRIRMSRRRCYREADSPFDLVAYTDSDYARASLDRKSTTGGCQFLRCRLISWQCKKQTVVANSITEAEYVAASSCCGQVL
ncbi:uncharacterized mitochondrial protein-like protein [Tanacetum coccineum]